MGKVLVGGTYVSPGPEDFWQPLFGTDGAWAITRPMLLAVISLVLILAVYLKVSGGLRLVPSRVQYLAESSYDLVRNTIARDIIGAHDFMKFVPLLFTMFILILTNNVFGNVPGLQFPTMSRLAFPAALTLVVYFTYHIVGIRKRGLFGYLASFVPAGVPGWLVVPLFLIEFVTYTITRPMTLALRLMGNMLAGHLLILVFVGGGEYLLFETHNVGFQLAGAASFLFSIVMSFFEMLIQFLQAYIFTLLSALYIAGAVADEH